LSVRLKIALTIFVTGALTALGVIGTVLLAFQRFEHETAYYRADQFLQRVVAMYDNMLELHATRPEEFNQFLRNLVLFEPDTQLYLLDPNGRGLVVHRQRAAAAGIQGGPGAGGRGIGGGRHALRHGG
jgi:hypothetical protein